MRGSDHSLFIKTNHGLINSREDFSGEGARCMHAFAHHHHGETGEAMACSTRGWVMNLGWRYDLLVWFFDTFVLRGTLRKLRDHAADLAQLQPGEAVL